VNVGALQVFCGQVDLARETLDDARRVSGEIGHSELNSEALMLLGMLSEECGEEEEAQRLYESTLTLKREAADTGNVAYALIALARVLALRGDGTAAVAHVKEALSLASEIGLPGATLSAKVGLARLPGGNVDAALMALEEYGERVDHAIAMDSRFRLWELTGQRVHLSEAHRLLCHLRDHAPKEYRKTMIANVRLHRDIMAAWVKHQAEN
jgi:tetratricopeptide (TPR) repeat protein